MAKTPTQGKPPQPLKSGTPLGRPKDLAKRAAILDAARDLFFQYGVVPVTIDAIAKRARVSRVTVYAHFAEKQTLFREVIRRQATTLAEAVSFSRSGTMSSENGTFQELRSDLTLFGITFVQFLSRPDIKAWNRLRHEEASNFPDLATTFRQGASVVMETLSDRLEAAKGQSLLKMSDTNAPARQLIGMFASLDVCSAIGYQEKQTEATITQHVDGCVQAFLRAYGEPTHKD